MRSQQNFISKYSGKEIELLLNKIESINKSSYEINMLLEYISIIKNENMQPENAIPQNIKYIKESNNENFDNICYYDIDEKIPNSLNNLEKKIYKETLELIINNVWIKNVIIYIIINKNIKLKKITIDSIEQPFFYKEIENMDMYYTNKIQIKNPKIIFETE